MEARLEPAHIADREAPQVSEPAPAPEPERLSHESERLAVPGLSRPGSAEPIRRKASAEDPLGGTSVHADTARRLAGSATSGRALDPKVRGPLESAFRADFGDVNVHTDGNAAQLARDVQATAFTHGNNIYFSPGAYNPGSAQGQHLLAHELTHVVQQQGRAAAIAPAGGGTLIGRADDPAELEAEHTARDVVGALRRQAVSCGPTGHDHSAHDHGALDPEPG
ncbi:MAG: hypothetical protein QOJ78_6 [Pseudonocardiales bacterium]|nr:hypothetical protein [Pseudonocardiales bacterium]